MTLTGWSRQLFAEHVEQDRALLRLVELDEQQSLPLAEERLARAHRDGVRRRPQEHLAHVGLAVGPLVPLLEVLGATLQVVVRVVHVARNERLEASPEVLERAVLPFV